MVDILRWSLSTLVCVLFCLRADAESASPPAQKTDALREQGYSVSTISPIFSQLVSFSLPKGFVPAFENAKPDFYIREAVPVGQSVDMWSQMITVTGSKDLATKAGGTPVIFASGLADRFRKACPATYSGGNLGPFKVGSYEGFAAVIACGTAGTGVEPHSEVLLALVVRGERDIYSIQWAERGPASETPLKLNDPKWVERTRMLGPIKLCPIVPGEAAPYPSCVGGASANPAQSPVQKLIPELMPVAEKARLAVVTHPTLAAFEIDAMIKDAIKNAKEVYKQPSDIPAARQILRVLEPELGPLDQIPSFDLHLLLGAMEGAEGNTDKQTYHRAYGVAVMLDLDKSGNAFSLETAPKIVMIQEEYAWFFLRSRELTRQSRVAMREAGRLVDIWTVKTKDDKEIRIYFDAGLMQASAARVMDARSAGTKR
jgi:hypothetical protein